MNFFYFAKERSNSFSSSNHLSPLTSAAMQGELLKIVFYLEMLQLVLSRLLIRVGTFLFLLILLLLKSFPLYSRCLKQPQKDLSSDSSCIFTCYYLGIYFNGLIWGLLLFDEIVKMWNNLLENSIRECSQRYTQHLVDLEKKKQFG